VITRGCTLGTVAYWCVMLAPIYVCGDGTRFENVIAIDTIPTASQRWAHRPHHVVGIEGVFGDIEDHRPVNAHDEDAVITNRELCGLERPVRKGPVDRLLNGERAFEEATRVTVFDFDGRHCSPTEVSDPVCGGDDESVPTLPSSRPNRSASASRMSASATAWGTESGETLIRPSATARRSVPAGSGMIPGSHVLPDAVGHRQPVLGADGVHLVAGRRASDLDWDHVNGIGRPIGNGRVDIEVRHPVEDAGIERLAGEVRGGLDGEDVLLARWLDFLERTIAGWDVHRSGDRGDVVEGGLDGGTHGAGAAEDVLPEVGTPVAAGDDDVGFAREQFGEGGDDAVDRRPVNGVAEVVVGDGYLVGDGAADGALVGGWRDGGDRTQIAETVVKGPQAETVDTVVVG